MGQMYVAFRHAQEMAGLVNGYGNLQGMAVRHSNVLACKTDQPSCDVEGILASLEHPAHPVYGGIRVAVAHGFVEGGDQVVMFFTVLIIQKGFPADALGKTLRRDRHPLSIDLPVEDRHFQGVEGCPGISVGKSGDGPQLFWSDPDGLGAEAGRIFQGIFQEPDQVGFLQCL